MNGLHHTQHNSVFLVQLCTLCPKPWHLKHCWIEDVIRNSSTLNIMSVFWHINPHKISASACFGLSHLIKGRSLPVLLDFIRSASAWVILLKSINSLKSFTVMFIDTPLKTKILPFEAVVYSSDFTFNKFCVRIFPSKLTHARDPLLIPFKIRTQNFLRTLDRLFSSQTRNTAR